MTIIKTDNCLLMHESVETAFDKGNFVLLPVDKSENPVLRWGIKMTNVAAANTDMGRVSLKQLDSKEIIFKNSNRPASRFLYYHFVVTLLRNKRDRQPGWDTYLTELPTEKPFDTVGGYLRESMLLALAKAAGDLDSVEEARLLGGETFVEAQTLSEVEEAEGARRALEAHEVRVKEDDDDDDESSEDDCP